MNISGYEINRQFIRENKYIRIGLFALFLIIVATLFPRNKISSLSYEIGSGWLQDDIISPFTFSISKSESIIESERKIARSRVLPVFRKSKESFSMVSFNQLIDSLQQWSQTTTNLDGFSQKSKPLGIELNDREYQLIHSREIKKANSSKRSLVQKETQTIVQKGLLEEFRATLPAQLIAVLSDGVLDVPRKELETEEIAFRADNNREEKVYRLSSLRDSLEAYNALKSLLATRYAKRGDDTDTLLLALKIISPFLTPTLRFDSKQTMTERLRAEQSVPIAEGFVREGEKIIIRGEQITETAKRKLDSYLRAKAEREVYTGDIKIYIGKILIIVMMTALFVVYVYLSRPTIFYDNLLWMLLMSVALSELILTWYLLRFDNLSPYLVPISLASIIFAVIFDSRTAFLATVTIAMLAATIRGNDFPFALASIFAGTMAVFVASNISQRRQLVLAAIYVFVAYSISILAFNFARLASQEEILNDLKFAAISSLASFLVYPILLVIEKIFGVTTDLTLIELANVNHPLLREMSSKAPGTFNHTMQVSHLSEEAAMAIGANPLLCRAGAYFHDIGKVKESDFFAENQRGENPHEQIHVVTSGRIIGEHVKEGIEVGKRYKLPEKVLDFIPQHHGTTVIHFFYEKAKRQLPPDQVNINDFKYPGPKPQSRETAIVMLADAVEASVRSLSTVNEQSISQIIDSIVKKRLDEEQFSECNLTFAELSSIKKSFIKTILASSHRRVKYPGQNI
ncbi:MAG: HDIG domain-containing protein [Chloroherpetonaceae bacterium]|nr:HDIG domain-containing protein [Chloroherpetonaceae bacterium]